MVTHGYGRIAPIVVAVYALVLVGACRPKRVKPSGPSGAGDIDVSRDPAEIRPYCERKTGIVWPASVTDVDLVDNCQFYVIGCFRLATKDIAAFISKHGFRPAQHAPRLLGLEYLNKANQVLPRRAVLLEIRGANGPRHGWVMYLDRASGRVWIQVTYPDWAGT